MWALKRADAKSRYELACSHIQQPDRNGFGSGRCSYLPTRWQADQFPQNMRRNLSVIFDGVDTEQLPLVRQSARNHVLTVQGWYSSFDPSRCPLSHLCDSLLSLTEDGRR